MTIKKIKILSVLPLFLLTLAVIPIPKANAATKTVELSTTPASDDPYAVLGAPNVSGTGVDLIIPPSATTTQLDDASTMSGTPTGYTWRVTMPELCDGAQIQSVRVVMDVEAAAETGYSGVISAIYSGSDDMFFRDNYTINEGEDVQAWSPAPWPAYAIDRGIEDDGFFPANLGVDGTLDATWDLVDYNPSDTLGIFIQHWLTGTTTAQTTIQSVTLSYDDSECDQPTEVLTNPQSSAPILLQTPNATTITSSSTSKESGLSITDAAYDYPSGLVSFSFDTSELDNEVSLTFVTDKTPTQVVPRKYNPTTNAYFTIPGAVITETTYNNQHALKLTYAITDNGDLDLDPDTGQIADPVGLAVQTTGSANTGLNKYWILSIK